MNADLISVPLRKSAATLLTVHRLLGYVEPFYASFNFGRDRFPGVDDRFFYDVDVKRRFVRWNDYSRAFEHRITIATVDRDKARRRQRIVFRVVQG